VKEKAFNRENITDLADRIELNCKEFDKESFCKDIFEKLDFLELKERGDFVSENLTKYLPKDFKLANEILLNSLEEELIDLNFPLRRFIYISISDFVVQNYDDFDLAMDSLREITKRFSAEFSIRKMVEDNPKKAFEYIYLFTKDENEHVRRLASEGTRISLPWAKKVNYLDENLELIISVLDRLKLDKSRYVQKSIANSLNDISKVDSDLVLKTLKSWREENRENKDIEWIVNHSLRTLIKECDRDTLEFLGYGEVEIEIANFNYTKDIDFNSKLEFEFELKSDKKEKLLIDYAIHFQKKNAKLSKKVFKLVKKEIDKSLNIKKSYLFTDRSTRKYYAGLHKLEILINGKSVLIKDFYLKGEF